MRRRKISFARPSASFRAGIPRFAVAVRLSAPRPGYLAQPRVLTNYADAAAERLALEPKLTLLLMRLGRTFALKISLNPLASRAAAFVRSNLLPFCAVTTVATRARRPRAAPATLSSAHRREKRHIQRIRTHRLGQDRPTDSRIEDRHPAGDSGS